MNSTDSAGMIFWNACLKNRVSSDFLKMSSIFPHIYLESDTTCTFLPQNVRDQFQPLAKTTLSLSFSSQFYTQIYPSQYTMKLFGIQNGFHCYKIHYLGNWNAGSTTFSPSPLKTYRFKIASLLLNREYNVSTSQNSKAIWAWLGCNYLLHLTYRSEMQDGQVHFHCNFVLCL